MTETIQIKVPKWNIESETGYKPRTTFWQDFSIADAFGGDAVTDTFHRAFNEWKDNCVYITELVMVLNHKIAQWYEKNMMYVLCLFGVVLLPPRPCGLGFSLLRELCHLGRMYSNSCLKNFILYPCVF